MFSNGFRLTPWASRATRTPEAVEEAEHSLQAPATKRRRMKVPVLTRPQPHTPQYKAGSTTVAGQERVHDVRRRPRTRQVDLRSCPRRLPAHGCGEGALHARHAF